MPDALSTNSGPELRTTLIGVSEMRAKLYEVIAAAADHDVTVLRHNRPVAVVISPERLEALRQRIEDLEDAGAVLEQRINPEPTIPWSEIALHDPQRSCSVANCQVCR